MTVKHYVVVGNGPAGNKAALTLRDQAPDDRITLISKDRESCYRPHLIPGMLAGKIEEQDMFVCDADVYNARNINLRRGQSAVALDPVKKEITLDHKEVLSFDGIIIAVGGRPRIPESLDPFKDYMFTLKTLEDARLWMDHLEGADEILVMGGDLTSFGTTRALIQLEKKLFFILNKDSFWPMRPDEEVFDQAAEKLSNKGVEVLRPGLLKGISRKSSNRFEVQVDDRVINVDMLGAFFGLVPDIGFLAGSGLKIDRGVLVDEYLNAGFEGVYATGDCAQIYHPGIKDYWVSIGHENAMGLGRIAAMNLAGSRIKAEVPEETIFGVDDVKINTSWWLEF